MWQKDRSIISESVFCFHLKFWLLQVHQVKTLQKTNNCSWYSHFPCYDLLTLAFHAVHVFPLSSLTMQLRKCVRIRARLLGSHLGVHPNLRDNLPSLVNPREDTSVFSKAVDLWKGITASGVLKENSAMSLWLVSSASACHFQMWVVRDSLLFHGQSTPAHKVLKLVIMPV